MHTEKLIKGERPFTYEDYVQWDGKWELHEGCAVDMNAAPAPRHQQVTNRLATAFTNAIDDSGCEECIVYDPIDYKIKEGTVVQPDLVIVCQPIEKAFLDFTPSLVAEVLSPSTMLIDKNSKKRYYQQAGVRYFLLVDARKNVLQIYELENEIYQEKEAIERFVLGDGCVISPDFGRLFR